MYYHSNKFKDKYRIPSNRLQGYDYGMNGCYYVTICTKNREPYFGKIVNDDNIVEMPLMASLQMALPQMAPLQMASLQKTTIGEIAEKFWLDIPNHFPFVVLDEFVVMPNHIHGILFFDKPDNNVHCENAPRPQKMGGITGVHNPMLHENLGRVIRWFKGRVSFECRKINCISLITHN